MTSATETPPVGPDMAVVLVAPGSCTAVHGARRHGGACCLRWSQHLPWGPGGHGRLSGAGCWACQARIGTFTAGAKQRHGALLKCCATLGTLLKGTRAGLLNSTEILGI
jgi:hypothetical protein